MSDRTYLDWPFFDEAHRRLARELDAWAGDRFAGGGDRADVDQACRSLVAAEVRLPCSAQALPSASNTVV